MFKQVTPFPSGPQSEAKANLIAPVSNKPSVVSDELFVAFERNAE